MIALNQILLPTDFSPQAEVARSWACQLCEQFKAELHLLHVLESHPGATPAFGMGLAPPQSVKESIPLIRKILDDYIDSEWKSKNQVAISIRDGAAFVEIVRYARDSDIDLIVLSTHGRTGIPHMMMGSVAERVVRSAPCPVLTVRPEGHTFEHP